MPTDPILASALVRELKQLAHEADAGLARLYNGPVVGDLYVSAHIIASVTLAYLSGDLTHEEWREKLARLERAVKAAAAERGPD